MPSKLPVPYDAEQGWLTRLLVKSSRIVLLASGHAYYKAPSERSREVSRSTLKLLVASGWVKPGKGTITASGRKAHARKAMACHAAKTAKRFSARRR